ncbi:MAG TPA: hypothetical protein VHR46_03795 [Gaiella sp.]|jgi:hypothetical protein|nr:hypothetical protein [Gaiella sp.]
MTSVVGRVYVVAGTLLAFFVLWAGIAARPWAAAAASDPRVAALDRREARIRRDAAAAQAAAAERWAAYRKKVAARAAATAAAQPRVRIVTIPAVTSTRTS